MPSREAERSSVASVMRDSCPDVEPDTPLERIIPLCLTGDAPVAVLDGDRCIGTISREAAIADLVSDEGTAT